MRAALTKDTLPDDGLRAGFDTFFATLGQGFNAYLERLARTEEVRRLEASTDAELAHLGIRREDIIRHVFRDRLYL